MNDFFANRTLLRIAAVCLLIIPASAGLLIAGADSDQAAEVTVIDADSTAQYERRIDLTVDGLSHAVELWHDANLKEDAQLAARYEILIDNILRADLKATEMVLKNLEAECDRDGSRQDPKVKAELEDTHRVLFEKEQLVNSIRKSDTFSEKYRLLGGYINSLRRELGLPKLRLADDKEPSSLQNP
ncbi:hypothetical protein GF420_07065 [candidate division GN15 bacterium]|nr:hypothetical protein [candidate division GN15 bacterium]